MSVSFLTRMAHFQASVPSSGLLTSDPLILSLTSPSTTTSSSSPPGSLCSLAGSFCSGSNFAPGNLSLQSSSPWTSGSGARNPHRTVTPDRPDEALHSSSLDMIEAQLSMRRAVAAASSADRHPEPLSTTPGMSLGDISTAGSSAWNPFSLLPFIHSAALVSSAASFPTVTGSTTTSSASASESALNAWSAAAAAAAAAYASLLPSGRTMDGEAESRRVRGK